MPPKSKEQYIPVKPCPICGESPQRITTQLGRPGGHGYPGKHDYQYVCECCGLVKGQEHHDIYDTSENAINRAKKSWNDQVTGITEFLSRNWIHKTLVENEVV